MAGDAFRHVLPGHQLQIPAAVYNALLDLLDAPDGQPSQARRGGQAGTIRVKNNSGGNRARFNVLGLDVPIITPTENADEFKRQVTFIGVAPAAGTHEGKYCVLQEPIKAGEFGAAIVAGVTVTRLTVGGTLQDYAEIADAAYVLVNGTTGSARVLWAEASGAERWAIVRLAEEVGGGVIDFINTYDSIDPALEADALDVTRLLVDTTKGLFVGFDPAIPYQGNLSIHEASGSSPGVVTASWSEQSFQGAKNFLEGIKISGSLVDLTNPPCGAIIFNDTLHQLSILGQSSHAGVNIQLWAHFMSGMPGIFSIHCYNATATQDINAHFEVVDNTGTRKMGVYTTLSDGTIVSGGLVTSAGAGDFDFGTF